MASLWSSSLATCSHVHNWSIFSFGSTSSWRIVSAFRSVQAEDSVADELTKDLEDTPAEELLSDLREIRGLLDITSEAGAAPEDGQG